YRKVSWVRIPPSPPTLPTGSADSYVGGLGPRETAYDSAALLTALGCAPPGPEGSNGSVDSGCWVAGLSPAVFSPRQSPGVFMDSVSSLQSVGARARRLVGRSRRGRAFAHRARIAAHAVKGLRELSGNSHLLTPRFRELLLGMLNPVGQAESAWAEIEKQRERLLRDFSSLDSLGSGAGPYDSGHTVAEVANVSKHERECQVLYAIARVFAPRNVIELGTNVGISGAYLAAGIRAAGSNGTLHTLEASGRRLELAKAIHRELGFASSVVHHQGLFDDILPEVLATMDSVDVAFIDGHHLYEPTLRYFEAIRERSTSGTLFVFDDIAWSEGMRRAWSEIERDPSVAIALRIGGVGLVALS
ncbi:MAG: class I SAM-dependent methyltransferase, partial [Myxococcota bacterium]